eukprot:GHVT01089325.1.p1 GENE.GHVT01089325.1~~GHVT01089325.1.p1  ORF type:complete len:180 (+),score=14.74 GHVT01089325.1:25-540(+)
MRDVMKRPRERTEAAEAGQKETTRGTPAVDVADTGCISSTERVAMRQMVEKLVIGRTAEALRRRAAERLTLGVAVYGAVFQGVVSDTARSCTCLQDAEAAISTATPLPRQEDSRELHAAILQILDNMREECVVDLHDYPLARYDQNEDEDRKEVEKAQMEGRNNPSSRYEC